MSHIPSLHDRIFEGFSDDVKHALAVGMQTPERFGGPPEKPKERKKPKPTLKKPTLKKRLKRFATDAGRVMFPRSEDVTLFDQVFTESDKKKLGFVGSVKKIAKDAHEYADVSDPTHPWNKILVTAKKWSDQGGALAGKDQAKPQAKLEKKAGWGSEALKRKSSSKDKKSSKSKHPMKVLRKSMRDAQRDRDRVSRGAQAPQGVGRSNLGAPAKTTSKQPSAKR